MNALKLVFLAKTCFKVVFGSVKIREAIVFPCRSLLLSTNVLNDDTTVREMNNNFIISKDTYRVR